MFHSLGKVQIRDPDNSSQYLEVEHIDVGDNGNLLDDEFLITSSGSKVSRRLNLEELLADVPGAQASFNLISANREHSTQSNTFYRMFRSFDHRPHIDESISKRFFFQVLRFGRSDNDRIVFECQYEKFGQDYARCFSNEHDDIKYNEADEIEALANYQISHLTWYKIHHQTKAILKERGINRGHHDYIDEFRKVSVGLLSHELSTAKDIMESNVVMRGLRILEYTKRDIAIWEDLGFDASAIGYTLNVEDPKMRIVWDENKSLSSSEEAKRIINNDIDYIRRVIKYAQSLKSEDSSKFTEVFNSEASQRKTKISENYPDMDQNYLISFFEILDDLHSSLKGLDKSEIVLEIDEAWSIDLARVIDISDLMSDFSELFN